MKILIAGNLANLGYETARSLREYGIDARLLIPKNPIISEDPKSISSEMMDYPEWIVFFDKQRKALLNNWKIQIIKEMRKSYDGIIALTEFSIFAMFSGKPYAALSTGNDMRELAFEKSLKGFLYRLSYKKARMVIWGEPYKKPLLKKLKIEKKSFFATTPRRIKIETKQGLKKTDDKFIIFHPTAQDWNYKNNKIFLEAFVKICDKFDNIYLILSDRGPNIEEAKSILSSVSGRMYEFIPFISSNDIGAYYQQADLVVDQFGVGSFGMIAVEAMFHGKPVLLRLDNEFFKEYYEKTSGLITADSVEQISGILERLIKDKELRNKLAEENIRWVNRNWDHKILTERYVTICKKLIK